MHCLHNVGHLGSCKDSARPAVESSRQAYPSFFFITQFNPQLTHRQLALQAIQFLLKEFNSSSKMVLIAGCVEMAAETVGGAFDCVDELVEVVDQRKRNSVNTKVDSSTPAKKEEEAKTNEPTEKSVDHVEQNDGASVTIEKDGDSVEVVSVGSEGGDNKKTADSEQRDAAPQDEQTDKCEEKTTFVLPDKQEASESEYDGKSQTSSVARSVARSVLKFKKSLAQVAGLSEASVVSTTSKKSAASKKSDASKKSAGSSSSAKKAAGSDASVASATSKASKASKKSAGSGASAKDAAGSAASVASATSKASKVSKKSAGSGASAKEAAGSGASVASAISKTSKKSSGSGASAKKAIESGASVASATSKKSAGTKKSAESGGSKRSAVSAGSKKSILSHISKTNMASDASVVSTASKKSVVSALTAGTKNTAGTKISKLTMVSNSTKSTKKSNESAGSKKSVKSALSVKSLLSNISGKSGKSAKSNKSSKSDKKPESEVEAPVESQPEVDTEKEECNGEVTDKFEMREEGAAAAKPGYAHLLQVKSSVSTDGAGRVREMMAYRNTVNEQLEPVDTMETDLGLISTADTDLKSELATPATPVSIDPVIDSRFSIDETAAPAE